MKTIAPLAILICLCLFAFQKPAVKQNADVATPNLIDTTELALTGTMADTMVARIYRDRAQAAEDKSSDKQALKYSRKALTIYRNQLGEMDSLTAVAYNGLGNAYMLTGKYDSCLLYLEKAKSVFKNLRV